MLKGQVDSLEQYSRRNCIRTGPVPETSKKSTDQVVKTVAQSIGVSLAEDAIDRSHRVGKATSGTARERPILVKFTSYKHKEALLKARRRLNQIDAAKILPEPEWPSLPPTATATVTATGSSGGWVPPIHTIYINEELTKTRAEVELKRVGKLDDTRTRYGFIFVKKSDPVNRIATLPEIQVFN